MCTVLKSTHVAKLDGDLGPSDGETKHYLRKFVCTPDVMHDTLGKTTLYQYCERTFFKAYIIS